MSVLRGRRSGDASPRSQMFPDLLSICLRLLDGMRSRIASRGARRPSKKVSKKTPRTWGSMSKSQKAKAVREKKKVGMGRRTSAIRKRKKKSTRKKK